MSNEELITTTDTQARIDPSILVGDQKLVESSITDNVKAFLEDKVEKAGDGDIDTILREQQLFAFADLAVFFSSTVNEGSMILPTGSGKTVIMAELANAIYYGTEDLENKPKTLVLVPNIKLIDQTAGEYDEKGEAIGGFARFAPQLDVTKYGGGIKDTSGDVVVMTYQSLLNAVESGNLPDFDVILLDEAHRSLGVKTDAAVSRVSAGKKAIAFTATPDFNDVKSVRDKRGEVIHEMSLREAIDLGMLAPVQVWHYKTDIKLNVPMRVGDFSEQELQSLIESESRNKAAVDLTANYVAQGLQGIISCVPGDNTRHAKEMATRLSETQIIDSQGVTRAIVARSVSGEMSKEERDAIYSDYRNGEIDVLTYVDLLTEGWDAPSAKFIINLRPTKSPVSAIQRLGRVLRLYRPDSVAQIVEFVDDINGADNYNAMHALGEAEAPLNTGEVYGSRRSSGVTETDGDGCGGFVLPDLERVRALIESCKLELLSDLYLTPIEREQRQSIAEGNLITVQEAIDKITKLGGQVSRTALLNAVGEVADVGGRVYIDADQLDALKERYIPEENDMNRGDVIDMLKKELKNRGHLVVSIHDSPISQLLDLFDRTARNFKAPGANYNSTVWKKQEIDTLLPKMLEPFDDGEYLSVFDYYHDDNGKRARYDKARFTRISQMARSTLDRSLQAMTYEERLEAVRLTVRETYGNPNIELVYRKDLIAKLSGGKNVYLRR